MGVPELLKFVARAAPGALCRIPRGSDAFCADYALVDCTNAIQTLGMPALLQFLTNPNVRIRHAIIFVLDGQRRRVGTSREQRVVAAGHENEVLVQQCLVSVAQHYQSLAAEERDFKRARHEKKDSGSSSAQMPTNTPMMIVCGRDVSGEGDYKMLHLHRTLVCDAAAREVAQPSFLFVSEDSDLLCGALCGPAGQNVTIATKLHGTTFELCLLRVSHVLAYIGKGADVLLYAQKEEQMAGKQADKNSAQVALPKQANSPAANQLEPVVKPQSAIDDGPRRKKVDGPMIALGKKTRLDEDSSSSDEEPAQAAPSAKESAAVKEEGVVNPQSLEVGAYLHQACVDLVFLFMTILGNGAAALALVKGATKVDIAQCWTTYCAKKYSKPMYEGAPIAVHALLTEKNTPSTGADLASFELNTTFLLQIYSALNYADSQSRPPSEEERQRSVRFLECAVLSTVRYMVASHRNSSATYVNAKWALLDSTHDSDMGEHEPPSFAALLNVLSERPTITFTFTFAPPPAGPSSAAGLQLKTDIDTSLVRLMGDVAVGRHSGNSGISTRHVGHMRPMALSELSCAPGQKVSSTSLRTIDQNISKAVQKLVNGSASPFHRLVKLWVVTLSAGVPMLQRVLLGEQQADKNTEGATRPMSHSYSFELRRLAPIAATAFESNTNSTAVAAALKAAGLAFDYASSPAPAPVSNAPPKSNAKNTKAPKQACGTAKPAPVAISKKSPASASKETGLAVSTAVGKKKKRSRRPGKKERTERVAKKVAAKNKPSSTAPTPAGTSE